MFPGTKLSIDVSIMFAGDNHNGRYFNKFYLFDAYAEVREHFDCSAIHTCWV